MARVPHEPQRFAPGATAEPQTGHVEASGEPHSMQKRPSAGLTVPQFAQVTVPGR